MAEEKSKEKKKATKATLKLKLQKARKKQLLYKKKAVQFRDKLQTVKSKFSKKLEELEKCHKELAEAQELNRDLQGRLQRSERELKEIRESVEEPEYQTSTQDTFGLMQELEQELEFAQRGKAKAERLLEELRAERDSVGREAEKTHEELVRTRTLVTDLRNQLNAAQSKIEEGEAQLGKRYESHRKASAEVSKLRDQTWAQREEIKKLIEENADQRQSLSRLQAQMREMERSR